MLFKRKFTLETDPASWAAGAAVLSAGAGTYSAISSANKKERHKAIGAGYAGCFSC